MRGIFIRYDHDDSRWLKSNCRLNGLSKSIGVVIGADLGTAVTGWIVSILGFKFKIDMLAFPLIGIGVFMKLLRGGKSGFHGSVLAGFGLIFVGIEIL